MEEVLRFYYASPRNPLAWTRFLHRPIWILSLAGFSQNNLNNGPGTSIRSIVELGAGKGILARDILEYRRFPYMILERSRDARAAAGAV